MLPSLLAAALLADPSPGSAQASPLVIEARVGGALPMQGFASGARIGEGNASGVSFGVDLVFSGAGRRAFYAGFAQHRFDCTEAGCPSGSEHVATGLDAGFRVSLRSRGSVIPWVRVGVLTTRVESEGVTGSAPGVSALGWGGEVGLGLYVGTSSPVALNPGIRLAAVNTELPGGALLRMRYAVVDLGLALAF